MLLTHRDLNCRTFTRSLFVSVMLLGLQLAMKAWMEDLPGGESFQWLSRVDQGFQVREDQSRLKYSHSSEVPFKYGKTLVKSTDSSPSLK